MRNARALALLVAAMTAGMALAASAASATETAEFVNEKTGEHCPDIVIHPPPESPTVEGGCVVHFAGLMTIRVDFGIFGEAHEATCNAETEIRTDELGNYYEGVELTPGDANCTTVFPACSAPWPGRGEEDGPSGVIQAVTNVCIDPAEGPVCQGSRALDIVETAAESYAIQFNNASVGLCEIDVDLAIESSVSTNAQLHVNHP